MRNKRITLLVIVLVILFVSAFVYEYVYRSHTVQKEEAIYEEEQKNARDNVETLDKDAEKLIRSNAEADEESAEDTQTLLVQEQFGLFPGKYIADTDCETYTDMDSEQVSGTLHKGDVVEVTDLAQNRSEEVYGQIRQDEKSVWILIRDKETTYFTAKS